MNSVLFNLVILVVTFISTSLSASISTPFCDHVEAIIFDCDGVLVDTEYLKFLAWQKALADLDIDLTVEEYQAVAGYSSKKIVQILQEMKQISIPDEVIPLKNSEYQKLQALGVPVIEKAIQFVNFLFENKNTFGIKLGLASSACKDEILINLKAAGIEGMFDVVISGSDDLDAYADRTGRNKPKPYIYLEAAKQLNVAPERCLVVEDTQAGIEAAVGAGMIALATPNSITRNQDFSKATSVVDSISELHAPLAVAILNGLRLKKDEDLENGLYSTMENCLRNFFEKGGCLKIVPTLLEWHGDRIQLNPDDAIYPVCSGGWCRSQSLWAILHPYSDRIVLFPPHAARVGWDPYNGKINRYRNYIHEAAPDEFSSFFGMEKAMRFGFENDADWKAIETGPTPEGLEKISQYYDRYYFRPSRVCNEAQSRRRVFIAFSNNAHVMMYRLIQTNQNLADVTLIAVESEDLITTPPSFLNTTPRSPRAYEHFADLLLQLFDLTKLVHETDVD